MAIAIELSKKESEERSSTLTQEEADYLEAIRESMKGASSSRITFSSSDAGPSKLPKSASPLSYPSSLPVSGSPPSQSSSLASPYPSPSQPASKLSSPLIPPVQPSTDDDEALAEQFAEEEDRAASAGPSNQKSHPQNLRPGTTTPPGPAPSTASRKHLEAQQSKFTVVNSDADRPPPLYHQVVTAQTTPPTKTPATFPSWGSSATVVTPSSSRPSGTTTTDTDKLVGGRSQSLNVVPTSSASKPSTLTSKHQNTLPTMQELRNTPPAQSASTTPGVVSPNSFIDQQLLYGVCESLQTHTVRSILHDF